MVSVKDRATQLVSAKVVASVDKETLNELVDQHTHESATVYTDGSTAYKGCKDHEHVRHSVEVRTWTSPHEWRRGFWASLTQGYYGVYHQTSTKHLHRHVEKFAGRHNLRRLDTIDQIGYMTNQLFDSEQPTYKDLIT